MEMLPQNVQYLAIHSSLTEENRGYTAKDMEQTSWRRYHYYLLRDGAIDPGLAERECGMHAYGHNWNSVAICLIGGRDRFGNVVEGFDNAYTPEQAGSLMQLLRGLLWKYPGSRAVGHRDLPWSADGDGITDRQDFNDSCPCFDVSTWVDDNVHL